MGAKGSTLKRVRQSNKRNIRNKHYKSMLNTSVKKYLNEQDKDQSEALLKEAISTIDKVVQKGVIHKNRGSQQKSKLMGHFNNKK
tara:strand:+ start:7692 stop:7946 length:255 start_codon:yes stop_codon:yes gene_type:complete